MKMLQLLEDGVNMSLWHWLMLVAFGTNPGIKVKLTDKGVEYGRQVGVASIQQKLNSISMVDISRSRFVPLIGKVHYSLSKMDVKNVGLPSSAAVLLPETGVRLSVRNASITVNGDWRVKCLRILKHSGSFGLSVSGITIGTNVTVRKDETGRPQVSSVGCVATIGKVTIKFQGGSSWLVNPFSGVISKYLRNWLQKQICPLVADAVTDLNSALKAVEILPKVDKYAGIDGSMVAAPTVERFSIGFSLKGEFYNIGDHQEPPFSATVFSLPAENDKMVYIGISAFTANSAAFVYHTAGVLSLSIKDDMIPKSSPIRLNTTSFGAFVPQIAQNFPDLMMELLVKTVKHPIITMEPDNVTVEAASTVTAYAMQPNDTCSPLFILNLEANASAQVFANATRLTGAVALNKTDVTLVASYVGDFQVSSLDSILQMVLKVVVVPTLNEHLAEGYPMPNIRKTKLANTKLQVLKDYLLIGMDFDFTQ
ncbi:bactericidal permeability-increasing protein-like [Dunckerocampus dactyliophorus]|uniref:bactericidal permeability-increasing protein-like n=1 Tax=Dunckerocampus dactyliophorus TaxID=161453 RepID=UPI002404E8C1|nr:bactericidal permeability-increasing protein-like [Dunckerocampus dactyliophorus]